jgi:hypothetical protein
MTLPRSRLLTLEAMTILPVARVLVDHVRLKHWRNSLGTIIAKPDIARHSALPPDSMGLATKLARQVERAAGRLPLHTKCLPRAITLQWMLRRRGLPSCLVIAMRKGANRSDDIATDDYHAWVECNDTILIGHCDRSTYHPLMVVAGHSTGAALPLGG